MKKMFFAFLTLICLSANVFAATELVCNQATSGSTANIGVPQTHTIYTNSLVLGQGEYFGVKSRARSASGAASMVVMFEESDRLPATEGAYDENWVVPTGLAAIVTDDTSEIYKINSLTPTPMKYGRFKLTGSGSNSSDTIVNISLCKQER